MNEPLSPRQKRWRVNVFAATWMSYAGFYFCRKNFGIVKKPLKDLLEVTDFEIAHIWTAYLAAYMFGQFLAGYLGRKTASRRLLLGGMAVSILCNLVFGATIQTGPAAYWPLFFFMIINGFAQATGWPGNIGALASWFRRDERGTIMGVWATCYQIGSFLAKGFAAFLYGWLGLVWTFWGASAVLFVVWVLFYFLERDNPEDLGLDPIVTEIEVDATTPHDPDEAAGDRWSPKVIRSVLVMGAAYFSFKFLRYALDSWAPLVMEETFDVSTSTAGYVSLWFDIAGFTSVVLSGIITDRYFGGRRATVAFGLSMGMVLAALFLGTGGQASITMFGVGLALVGFTLYGPDALLSGVGAIDVGSRKGAALAAGIINGIGSSGALLQEPAIGWVKTHYSMDAVFVMMVFVAVLGAIGTGVLWRWGKQGTSRF